MIAISITEKTIPKAKMALFGNTQKMLFGWLSLSSLFTHIPH